MLLTLAASSLRPYLRPIRGRAPMMRLDDLPKYTKEKLGLYGLNIPTDLLAGADFDRLDGLREAADKAGCPCLVLIESEAQPFADSDERKGEAAVERVLRVVQAAHRLGCNSVGVAVSGGANDVAFANASARLKRVLQRAERLEVNLLLMSYKGLCADPDRLTDLLKKVGGFRIGTFPDFEMAAAAPDPVHFLRRLTPYAAAFTAASIGFKPSDKPPGFRHDPYDLEEFAKAVASVGYQGTLAIDYRGSDDPETGIKQTRAVLAEAIGLEADEA